jgi:hypothetical protein
MPKILPVLLPESSFEDQASFLWVQSLRLSGQLNAERVLVYSNGGSGPSVIAQASTQTHTFVRVPDFIDLASFTQWCVPFPVFMRLACFHLYLDKVKENCSKRLLKSPDNEQSLYWTYWLHSQGISHLDHLV